MTNSNILKNRFSYLESLVRNKYTDLPSTGWATYLANNYLPYDLRDDLIAINQMRNILTHNRLNSGNDLFEPSDEVINQLEVLISFFEKPTLVNSIGTSIDNIKCARLKTKVYDAIAMMNKHGYSNIPVIDNNNVVKGVFSSESLLKMATDKVIDSLYNKTFDNPIIEKYLDLSSSRYVFVSNNETIINVEKIFASRKDKNRILMVFVTKSGNSSGELKRIITAYDIL